MSHDGAQGRYAGRSLAGGRYQLRGLLGEGGMASVHLAYDSVLDRQVAIKTLHTELGREQAFRERFRREAQAVAKLTHTNIVSIFDTGEDALFDGGSATGSSAPPPYSITPQPPIPSTGSPGGGKGDTGVVVGAVLVALVAIGGLIAALTLNGGSDDEGGGTGGGTDSSAAASPSGVAGHKGPDTTKTIETTMCTQPLDSYTEPDKIKIPDFEFKNIDSVKKCLQAAGWRYETEETDENTYGEDTVMDQYPTTNDSVDPDDMPTIVLQVSTGDPA